MPKKKVVVIGNCQARPIATLLEAMSDEVEITKVAIVHLLNSDQEAEYKPFFEEADCIIAQLVAPNYPCEFVQTDVLEKKYSHKLTKIVNLFCYADTPYLRNLPKSLRGAESPFGDYHFPVVYECWESGKDINTAVLELNKQNNNAAKQAENYEELGNMRISPSHETISFLVFEPQPCHTNSLLPTASSTTNAVKHVRKFSFLA